MMTYGASSWEHFPITFIIRLPMAKLQFGSSSMHINDRQKPSEDCGTAHFCKINHGSINCSPPPRSNSRLSAHHSAKEHIGLLRFQQRPAGGPAETLGGFHQNVARRIREA